MPSAREFARKKRNRNKRQRSRNLLMRNLLTAFGANRNYEMRRKNFLGTLQIFSTAGRQIFLDGRSTKTCSQGFCPYVRYRALRWQNSSIEIGFLFSEPPPGSPEAKRA
jgi:hypothetical protein